MYSGAPCRSRRRFRKHNPEKGIWKEWLQVQLNFLAQRLVKLRAYGIPIDEVCTGVNVER
jgi:hypothetical protein